MPTVKIPAWKKEVRTLKSDARAADKAGQHAEAESLRGSANYNQLTQRNLMARSRKAAADMTLKGYRKVR